MGASDSKLGKTQTEIVNGTRKTVFIRFVLRPAVTSTTKAKLQKTIPADLRGKKFWIVNFTVSNVTLVDKDRLIYKVTFVYNRSVDPMHKPTTEEYYRFDIQDSINNGLGRGGILGGGPERTNLNYNIENVLVLPPECYE